MEVSEKPAEGLISRIATEPGRFRVATYCSTRALHVAFARQPLMRSSAPAVSPRASARTRAVSAERSAPSALKTRASRALIAMKRSRAAAISSR